MNWNTTPDGWVGVGLYCVELHVILVAVAAPLLAATPAQSAPMITVAVVSGMSFRMPSSPSLPACAGAWFDRGRLPRGRIVRGVAAAHNIPQG